jgi:hypothetical protein
MTALPSVSIVVTTLGVKRFFKTFIETLANTDYSQIELIVMDNSKGDLIKSFAERYRDRFNKIIIVKKRAVQSYAKNCNEGVSLSKSRYVIVASDDIKFPRPDWLKLLVKAMESDRCIAAVGPTIMDWHCSKIISSGMLAVPVPPYRVHIDPSNPFLQRYRNFRKELLEVWSLHGPLIMIRRDVYASLGGMDEDYSPIAFEETDLLWRIKLMGFKIMVVLPSRVCHFERATTSMLDKKEKLFALEHLIDSCLKNLSWSWLFSRMPIIFAFEFVNLILNKIPISYLKTAIRWNIHRIPRIVEKRRKMQRKRKIKDKECFKPLSPISYLMYIVKQYYFHPNH